MGWDMVRLLERKTEGPVDDVAMIAGIAGSAGSVKCRWRRNLTVDYCSSQDCLYSEVLVDSWIAKVDPSSWSMQRRKVVCSVVSVKAVVAD